MENLSKNIVSQKTRHIIQSVNSLSDRMQMKSFFGIAPGLKHSLKNIDNDINNYLDEQAIAKIKAGIKVKAKIDDCENYLYKAKTMRISDADDIIAELDELKTWLFIEAEIARSNKMNRLING
jgi:conjugal transfer/entry exclusion protein